MPVIKNREDRLQRINARLNRWGGRPASTQELARLCQVSESAIKQDIAYLKDCHAAPIAYNRKAKGYYYTKPFDLAASITLTDQDMVALQAAVATLNQFRELSVFADFRGAVDKIGQAVRFRLGQATNARSLIAFESAPAGRGSELIEPMLEACLHGRPVQFRHRKYTDAQARQRVIFPYVVKEHRNRWYVVGFDEYRQEVRVFGLDRIEVDSVVVLDQEHLLVAQAPPFDTAMYFRQALGVAIYSQPPEEIVLLLRAPENHQFKAQPFFPHAPTDMLLDTPDELQVRLTIIINDELIYELARLGPKVRVISPLSLQQKLVTYLRDAIDQYESR
ncbi:helix-turn-helix transcriptional regulator [uncultured Fibrella sp.]|uniref:helix-turn-helix transcriptional regulator n=1 Tax=uncultured Fibrella sp. TaxID=1284596 RepID=UPI0035CA5AB8